MIEIGSQSFGSTGAQSISMNIISGVPDGILFFGGGKSNVNETANARNSMGVAMNDGSGGVAYQMAFASLVNNSGKFSREYAGTDAFVALDGASGNEATQGDVTGFVSGAVNVNLTVANSNFRFGYVAWKN